MIDGNVPTVTFDMAQNLLFAFIKLSISDVANWRGDGIVSRNLPNMKRYD